ncbi:branched-chain amino acid transport system II carrier protein [Clostridiisalibacter paucivorans]|uniref:branched-chain amino acid transport system II carrier protein n=1 Tax=Clostridiisalibacter paucivorans TaxID=408753 RepID=UPI00047AB801|nr:branched-chain amino acid transport system II carrier protein [Clostridiisalibacter paucivorans]
MKKLGTKKILVIGFALFAMFFGAGNLIFPPSIGLGAGVKWKASLLGFSLTGIGLPILGILSIAISGGSIDSLLNKVGSKFAIIFSTIIILLIGPLLATPRIGATAYELGVKPFSSSIGPIMSSIIFFGLTLLLTIKPSGIVDIIGKFLTPILLIMISIIIYKGVSTPIGIPVNTQISQPFSIGFEKGYQTMDLLAAIVFGSIIIDDIKNKGIINKKDQFKVVAKTGLIAAIGLGIVYGGLLYLGATGSSIFPLHIEKAALTTSITTAVLGRLGKVALGLCVYSACLTTSVSLTATVGHFFNKLSKDKVKYSTAIIISTIISIIISNTGVEAIVVFADPILKIVYPIAIVLVIINVFDNLIQNKRIYLGATIGAFCVSLVDGLSAMGVNTSYINKVIQMFPLADSGFGWILPAVLGIILTHLITKIKEKVLI